MDTDTDLSDRFEYSGGIATGLFALFRLTTAGYLLSGSGSFEAITATIGIALTAGILAGDEFHAFAK